MALDNVRFADQFSGSDIGAQINAAYANLPSSGEIIVVAKGGSFSTPIAFNAVGKRVILVGSPGGSVILTYTATTGTAITFDYGNNLEVGHGMRDITLTGPGHTTTTTGVLVGSTNGAQGVELRDLKIQSFGTNLQFGSNTWVVKVMHCMIRDGGTNVHFPSGLSNAGENIQFEHVIFADAPSPFTNSVLLEDGEHTFTDCSFDQAQLTLNNAQASVNGCHFENPNLGANYDFVSVTSSAGNLLRLTNSFFFQAKTTAGPTQFITASGGTVWLSGIGMFTQAGSPMTNFAVVSGGVNLNIFGFYDLSGNISGSLIGGSTTGKVIQVPGGTRNTVFNGSGTGGGPFEVNSDVRFNGKLTFFNGAGTVSGGVPTERALADLTGQTASIGTTTLFTAPSAGPFRVSVYHLCTTAGTAGTLATTIGWNDGSVAHTIAPAANVALTAVGNFAQGTAYLRVAAGQAITYSTTLTGVSGTPQYSLFIRVEAL